MNDRFTQRAQEVKRLANQEAMRLNHDKIGTGDILLGLIKEGSGAGYLILKNLGVDLRRARQEVEKLVPGQLEMVTEGKLPFTSRAMKLFEYSIEESRGLNHNYVGTEHLLLALLRDEECTGAKVLRNLGLRLADVRAEVLALLGHGEEAGTNEQDAVLAKQVLEGLLESAGKDRAGLLSLLKILTEDTPLRRLIVSVFRELIEVRDENPTNVEVAPASP